MKLYPAIDMLDGRAVRLVKGDFEAKTVYHEDPVSAAAAWVTAGARHLHVVDLDGARLGEPINLENLRRICTATRVPVQFGGGLRSPHSVDEAIAAGADRVVLGTAAFGDPEFLSDCLARYPGQVLVSVDVRGGKVATGGWTETIDTGAVEVIKRLAGQGVDQFVFTDVDRDGMLEGPDLEQVARLASAVSGSFIYSGGIGALADLQALAAMRAPTLDGVIVGKALYEGRFGVEEALTALRDSS